MMNQMNLHKRLLAIGFAFALLTMSGISYAQTTTTTSSTTTTSAPATLTPEQKLQHRMDHLDHMKKRLGLTDDQVAKLKTVMEQNEAKLVADRAAMKAATDHTSRRAARTLLIADRKAMMQQMKPILTPEQLKKYHEIREHQREVRQERRSN